jgi:hypothetical protein
MARADTTVTGTRGAITIDDTIEIPAGATATLNGTIVKGDVKVYRTRASPPMAPASRAMSRRISNPRPPCSSNSI